MNDYGFTHDQLLNIMGRADEMKPCCRSVLLKAVAFLDDETRRLGEARDVAADYAKALAEAINLVCDDITRRELKRQVRQIMGRRR